MTAAIRLHQATAAPEDPRRLNAFPGRHLSEREFELLQAYVDDRLAPLIHGLKPGIVGGLEVQLSGTGQDAELLVRPGQAVGARGRLIRLLFPLKEAWTDLAAQAEREADRPLTDGLYFLTLRSGVETIDQGQDGDACTRTEPDPLRDRRLEMVSLLGLQLVSANPRFLAMSPQRAANRVCVRCLEQSPFDPQTGAVPLALLKVAERQPVWIDTVAGRYLAEPNGEFDAFLAHTLTAFEDFLQNQAASLQTLPIRFVKPGLISTFARAGLNELPLAGFTRDSFVAKKAPLRPLNEVLDLDYLPAAGPFPITLLKDPAGVPPQLNFLPSDLQIDLVPVPASTVGSVVAMELPRGKVDLVHGLGERIRLLLAIPDLDYRPDLFNLPLRDTALEDELARRGWAATATYWTWQVQWLRLFKGLTPEQQSRIHPPQVPPPPREPDAFRTDLVNRRRAAMEDANAPLPEPYRSHLAVPHAFPQDAQPAPPELPSDAGIYSHRESLLAEIRGLRADLDEGTRLLSELGDYNTLQRHHLDALSVSFSALAGGISGDGKGLDLLRKTLGAVFVPKATTPPTGGQA